MITQIYEIQTPAEAEAVVASGVDRVGSVLLSEADWRDETLRETLETVRRSPAESSLIPLFNTPDVVFHVLDWYRPDIVHFCEALVDFGADAKVDFGADAKGKAIGVSPECDRLIRLQEEVRRRFPEIRIMRSIPIALPGLGRDVPTLALARRFEAASDCFLTDTLLLPESAGADAKQPVAGFVGITGKTCDWETAAELVQTSRIPVILAGGLDPDNVAEAIRRTRPAGVDSCTGTNARDPAGRPVRFRKDMARVRRFVESARSALDDLN